jgi:sigma-54 dependent transcriptional regulator, acetoin dehydrogenase operon transcriptional activator AcoR
MAGAFARQILGDKCELFCVGVKKERVDTLAQEIMAETGNNIPGMVSNIIEDVSMLRFDLAVIICDEEEKKKNECPDFAGSPTRLYWFISKPDASLRNKEEIKEAYRVMRDEISHRISHLVEDGYLDALNRQRSIFESMIENQVDGVLAHDANRKILYFNKAAEVITGYKYSDVINKDCHKIFPGRFCGGNCNYCEESSYEANKLRYNNTFFRKDGQLRDLEMSAISIGDRKPGTPSILVTFRDPNNLHPVDNAQSVNKGFYGIIGTHPSMANVYNNIREIANINVPVMIQGESGTGKEMVANAIHKLSSRADEPFVPVNCGALPEGILESELFGHVKGAFTGAYRDKRGRFELAEKGTIFLDEIGEISQQMQVKLLRVLQEKQFVPAGSETTQNSDVRIICATNKNLKLLRDQGEFREDLYYRLVVVPLLLPTLRQRQTDIPDLVEHFLGKFLNGSGRNAKKVSPRVIKLFYDYSWPGNIRELANTIQYALIKCHDSIINIEHLPSEITESIENNKLTGPGRPPKLKHLDVEEALRKARGNKSQAARILGVSRPTLYSFLYKPKV